MEDGYRQRHVEEFIEGWIERGDNEQDPFMRFVAYWVAFSMLYENYKHIGRSKNHRERSDRDAIRQYYQSNRARFGAYDPVYDGDAEIFLSDAAQSLYGSKDDAEKSIEEIRHGDRLELLFAVYKVRCNFFHGNKVFGNATDMEFVKDGATIVRGYLRVLGYGCDGR